MPSTTEFLRNTETVPVSILKTGKTWQDLVNNRGLPQAGCIPALPKDNQAARATGAVRRAKMSITLLAFNFNCLF